MSCLLSFFNFCTFKSTKIPDYGGDVTLRTNGGVSALSFIVRRVPDVVPRYICKFDDAVHVTEHEIGDVDCELTIDFRPLVPCLSRGEAELLLAFVEVMPSFTNSVARRSDQSGHSF